MSETDLSSYRPCVGAMLINRHGQAFVGKRIDNREGDWWQMPQGGVDPGEDLDAALLREVAEEVGARPEHLEIAARLPQELFYELPDDLKGKLWGGRYRGQRQTWYLVRFTGEDADIVLDAHHVEELRRGDLDEAAGFDCLVAVSAVDRDVRALARPQLANLDVARVVPEE